MAGRAWVPLVACAFVLTFLLALLPAASGNHPQAAHGDVLVFDHKTGNEWWVEAVLSGGASGSVAGVQAMDTGGGWVPLTKRSWGAWAASFHIEPGHQVRFRATWSGGDQAESCWFDHPSGAERCPTATTSTTTTTTGGTFNAPFTGFRGNEWWVQANVGTDGPAIAKVDVRIAPDGAWKPLTKQSWGATAWAASYHFPQGSVLQMRATASTGATDLSSCRQWIPPSGQDAAIVTCPGSQPPAFDATWSNVKGNEWWVEATIRANAPITVVYLTIDCDWGHDPHDMVVKPEWGKWVLGGIHIPAGSTITMQALGEGGSDLSATYLWPQGTVTEACPRAWPQAGSHYDLRFRDNLREFDGEGGEVFTEWDALVHAEFDGNRWDGTCQEKVTRVQGGVTTTSLETYEWDLPPAMGSVPAAPRRLSPGEIATVETVFAGCHLSTTEAPVLGRETRAFSIQTSSGDPVPIDAYNAGYRSTGFFSDYWWDARIGLVLEWDLHSSSQHHIGNRHGWLLDTDAEFR